MQWFKHESNANSDDKLQNVLLDYGLEGYGLYWYCLELIVNRVDKDNITFELKHDARIIAKNTGCSVQKVEEMMKRFIELGLFEASEGNITCLKILKRMDSSMTSNQFMRDLISKANKRHDVVMTASAKPMQEENRTEENRIKNIVGNKLPTCPHQEIIKLYADTLPMLTQVKIWSDKRQRLLKARWSEDEKRQSLEWWGKFFKYVAASDFLVGRASDWQCDIEWLLNSSNMVKVVEGKYHQRDKNE